MTFEHIAVVGAGAWGSALANAIARAGRSVTLWARDSAAAASIAQSRESPRLRDIKIDERVVITSIPDATEPHDVIMLAIPSPQLRSVAATIAPRLAAGTPVVACAKGIERGTHKFMTDVVAESMPTAIPAILSGPSFADDVARGLPAAVTLASRQEETAAALAQALGSATFRVYHSTDVRGAEIGGAAKNVLAIAAGIVSGRGLGASAHAALVTRGFAELFRFGKAYGAQPETLTGLSGLGDLILTCSSTQSRNFSLGVALGKGLPPAEARSTAKLSEGVLTALALAEMADEKGVDMPITGAVAAVIESRLSIDEAIENLLNRPLKAEA